MSANAIVRTTTMIANRKRKVFLRALAEGRSVAESGRAAGYTDARALRRYRKENEIFADEWAEAVETGVDRLEEEALRRAKDGVLEPTFYKGGIVGHTRKFSDSLMMFLLRGAKPERYRENVHGGQLNVNFGVMVMPGGSDNEEEWEAKTVEMHGKQKLIELPAKPTENAMLRSKKSRIEKIERGD